MKRLTQELHNDSKLIKILTFIAMLYTPASLMAVSTLLIFYTPCAITKQCNRASLTGLIQTIFSSNLVRVVSNSQDASDPVHMVLTSDFWKFPLLTVSLVVVTILPALLWWKLYPVYRRKVLKVGNRKCRTDVFY
jgi:hypothetical protein